MPSPSSDAPATDRTPTTSSRAAPKTTDEWPRENQNPALTDDLRSPAGRRQYLRGRFDAGTVSQVGGPGSHLVAHLARANCLVVVPEDVTELPAGAQVDVVLRRDQDFLGQPFCLKAAGVDMEIVLQKLQDDGVAAFAKSFETLLGAIDKKLEAITS